MSVNNVQHKASLLLRLLLEADGCSGPPCFLVALEVGNEVSWIKEDHGRPQGFMDGRYREMLWRI